MSDAETEEALPEALLAHLERHNRSFLLTLRGDGSPTAHPMTALVDRDALAFNTYRKSAKTRNVTRDERLAAVLLDGYEPRPRGAVSGYVIEGRGRVERVGELVARRGEGPSVSEGQQAAVAQRVAEGKRILIRTQAERVQTLGEV